MTVMPGGAAPGVTVVGGGLAGMTAALRLLERGVPVTLLEAGDRLGGQAGARLTDGGREDHGYHIFPLWYLNAWRLIGELGIEGSYRDARKFHQVLPGEWPRLHTIENFTSLRFAFRNLGSGLLPLHKMVLYYYAAFDLMSQRYDRRAYLDLVSVNGFLRSRFYRSEEVARLFGASILGGISAPSYEASAMTVRNVLRYWMRHPEPMFRILRDDLQTAFIEPLARRLEALGCRIEVGRRVTGIEVAHGAVTGLRVQAAPSGDAEVRPASRVVMAVPADVFSRLIDGPVHRAAPELGSVHDINVRPMAAFTLTFEERLPDVPPDHVNLMGSRYGISFIDVAQTWPGHPGSVLSCIASAFTHLEGLTDDEALDELVADMIPFVPDVGRMRLVRRTLQAHLDSPLVMNDVGAWIARPGTLTGVGGLVLAGAWCRNHVDLVTMESAIASGLLAAEAVRADLGVGDPIVVDVPAPYPQWLLSLGRNLLLPVAAVASLVDRIVG